MDTINLSKIDAKLVNPRFKVTFDQCILVIGWFADTGVSNMKWVNAWIIGPVPIHWIQRLHGFVFWLKPYGRPK